MGQDYEPTAIDDLYDHAFAKMNEILGRSEQDKIVKDLHSAADKMLVAFRDLLDGAVCAQAGVYENIEENIFHAEHEISLALHHLKSAKSDLRSELANQKK